MEKFIKETIKNYSEFKFVMNNGVKTVFKHSVIFTMNEETFKAKFKKYTNTSIRFYGILTSKKLGGAVTRNLIKRRIRAAIYDVNLNNNVWIIAARVPAVDYNFEKLKKEIHSIL